MGFELVETDSISQRCAYRPANSSAGAESGSRTRGEEAVTPPQPGADRGHRGCSR
jgi:hypothetical protein